MLPLKSYMRYMWSLVRSMNQVAHRHRYIDFVGEPVVPDYTNTR